MVTPKQIFVITNVQSERATKMYAIYSNPGALDLRALTIMGMNAKPNTESPIGYFGTGLKYAIAIALRHDLQLTIYDGAGTALEFFTVEEDFRGRAFAQCKMRAPGDPAWHNLPFTTEYGKDWALWEMHRELECNARDEGGTFRLSHDLPNFEAGTVTIVLSGAAFIETIQRERESIFFDLGNKGPVAVAIATLQARGTASPHLYFRGMRAFTAKANRAFAFTYNLTSKHLKLTENRTLQDTYYIGTEIASAFKQSDDFAKALIRNPDAYEWTLISWIHPLSDNVLNWVRGWSVAHKIPAVVEQQMWSQLAARDLDHPITGTEEQTKVLARAVEFLEAGGYRPQDYPIKIARSLPSQVLGLAKSTEDGDTIFIAERAFKMGFETVCAVLLEEYIHLDRKLEDNSREMQTFLLEEIIHLLKLARNLAAGENTAKLLASIKAKSDE
jgi:hypothetical protein